jgi:hypothetical protein
MNWWQWVLIVVAIGFIGVVGLQLPSLLRYLKIKRM